MTEAEAKFEDQEVPEEQQRPVVPAKPIVVSKEDLLEADNLHLRAVVAHHELQQLQQTVQSKMLQLRGLEESIRDKRGEIEKKYGIDLNLCDIREGDGVVIPKTNGMAQRIQRIQGGG